MWLVHKPCGISIVKWSTKGKGIKNVQKLSTGLWTRLIFALTAVNILKQLGKIIRKIYYFALNFQACCFLIWSFSDVSLRLAAMASLALLRFQSKLPTSYSRQFQMYIKFEKPSSTWQISLFELKY